MFQSFDGVADAPGDTQPDSQMFRQYTSGILESVSNRMPSPKPLFDVAEESADRPTDSVELVSSSQERRSPVITSPTVIHDDSEIQSRMGPPPTSPLKFETPALASKKRDNQGHVLSSAIRTEATPGTVLSASAFFGFGNEGHGNGMSLTQAFNATQAGTSPIVGAPIEDPVFQRPSPNFTNARQSSPVQPMSSPIKAPRRSSPAIRSSSEPKADYETMKQSQERRKREVTNRTSAGAQESWEEPTAVQRRFEKRKAKERFKQQAARSLSGVSTPAPSRQSRKRGLLSISSTYVSPAKTRSSRARAFDGSHDSDGDDGSPDELSQPANGHGEGDSPDELSQDILSSARVSRTPATVVKHSSGVTKVQVPNTSSHPTRTPSGQSARNTTRSESPTLQIQRESQFRAPASQPLRRGVAKLRSGRESEIIMDSQPDPSAEPGSTPKPLRFPSSPSSNQYSINQTTMRAKTGYTSQVVSSSIPPMPPSSSSQQLDRVHDDGVFPEDNEERVPSSPPIVPPEDITYDEHAYEEHSEGEGEEELRQAPAASEDVNMDDEEDLPVAKDEVNAGDEEVESRDPAQKAGADVEPEEPNIPDRDVRSDDEVPETTEREGSPDLHNEEEELIRSSHPEEGSHNVYSKPEAPRRNQRQSTVPETDMFEETQPSFFREGENGAQGNIPVVGLTVDDSNAPNQTNSTEPFHTAQEQQSTSQSNRLSKDPVKAWVDDNSPEAPKIRSLLDIANQPGTQRSTDLDGIEMPQLSFVADHDEVFEDMISGSSPTRPIKKRKITYSAKKAFRSPVEDTDPPSDHLSTSPLKGVQNVRKEISSPLASASEREGQGALAAERAREEAVFAQPATLKSRKLLKPSTPQTPRKGALKPVNRALFMTSPRKSPPKSTVPEASTAIKPPSSAIVTQKGDVEMRDADDHTSEADELARPTPQANESDHVITSTSDAGEAPTGELLVPNRVFAFWPGKNYYPATCLGRADARRLRVRFDDGNMYTSDSVQIRALDLRDGDLVKVDVTGMKKHTYVVVGFKDKIDPNASEEYPLTDRHGYSTIVLEEKQRDSLPAPEADALKKHIAVPMGCIYLTTQLWSRIRDRYYQFSSSSTPSASVSRHATPGTADGLPTPTYPRRSTAGPSLLRESITRTGSVASSVLSGGNSFMNMAFAITLTNDASDKDAITRLITSNGGQILDSGFHELFDVEASDAPMSSEGTAKVVSGLDGLLLKREYKDLGFVALISDSHSRRTKHFQALALNIPVLHLRWIQDSLSASRPLPFVKYLLPAGLSTYLDPEGVVRSRIMSIYDPTAEDTSFMQMVKERELLLRNQSVLIITGRSKKEVERKEPYIFLTHALGPADVGTCKDLATAKALVKDGEWDWVYVDGGADAVAEAASTLFGGSKSAAPKKKGSRKRKRDESAESEVLVRSGMAGGKKLRIACDEFIIQSLILGALIEE